MRFGVSGATVPNNIADVTPEVCRQIKEQGFSGVFCRFYHNDPFTTTKEECQRARDVFRDNGLELYQVTGYQPCLINLDESLRKEAVRKLQAALRVAGWVGARGIDTGPGSMHPSPRGAWLAHPANWTPAARRQLIRSLRECAPAAEDAGVYLSLENQVTVTTRSPEIARDVLDAVDSRWVTCDLDCANWITLDNVFETGKAIDHMFDVLGDHIISGHAKEVVMEERHSIHIGWGALGTGYLDFKTYLRRMEVLNPSFPLIVEGVGPQDIPAAAAFLHATASDLGIKVV